jgi:hypothetical protein
MDLVARNDKFVSERTCLAELRDCAWYSCGNFSTCVMDLVATNVKYVSERSCCAELRDFA